MVVWLKAGSWSVVGVLRCLGLVWAVLGCRSRLLWYSNYGNEKCGGDRQGMLQRGCCWIGFSLNPRRVYQVQYVCISMYGYDRAV